MLGVSPASGSSTMPGRARHATPGSCQTGKGVGGVVCRVRVLGTPAGAQGAWPRFPRVVLFLVSGGEPGKCWGELAGLAPGAARGSPWGTRPDSTPVHIRPGPAVLVDSYPGDCPPGEDMVWSGPAALADETPMGAGQPGLDRQDGRWHAETLGDVGRRWPMFGWHDLCRICTVTRGRPGHGDDPTDLGVPPEHAGLIREPSTAV
jgi:hypothetical protein